MAHKPPPPLGNYGENAVTVSNLTFSYPKNEEPTLRDLSMICPKGSRTLLMGANGSGKSTLMRILAGRHLTKPDNAVVVLGMNAFRDTKLNFHRAYLDVDWGMRSVAFAGSSVPLMADIAVKDMMKQLQEAYPERRDELVQLLEIDLENWRMHQLSDGQRRRVQLMLGLVRPFELLLLDEVTISLDVCVRQDLLKWLVKESEERGATILYATHIFDGLDEWASHLMYLDDKGFCGWQGEVKDLPYYRELKAQNHPAKMLAVADHWLRAEMERRRAERRKEKAALVNQELDPLDRQGGYASGRNIDTTVKAAPSGSRQGRLSDIMGNRGKMATHHNTA